MSRRLPFQGWIRGLSGTTRRTGARRTGMGSFIGGQRLGVETKVERDVMGEEVITVTAHKLQPPARSYNRPATESTEPVVRLRRSRTGELIIESLQPGQLVLFSETPAR